MEKDKTLPIEFLEKYGNNLTDNQIEFIMMGIGMVEQINNPTLYDWYFEDILDKFPVKKPEQTYIWNIEGKKSKQ